ncbi:MAG: hypothetical protein WBL58_04125, partial [Peptococcia bacterium]
KVIIKPYIGIWRPKILINGNIISPPHPSTQSEIADRFREPCCSTLYKFFCQFYLSLRARFHGSSTILGTN